MKEVLYVIAGLYIIQGIITMVNYSKYIKSNFFKSCLKGLVWPYTLIKLKKDGWFITFGKSE